MTDEDNYQPLNCRCKPTATGNIYISEFDKDFTVDARCTCPGFINQMKREVIGDSTGVEAAKKIADWIEKNQGYYLPKFVDQLKKEKEYFLREE